MASAVHLGEVHWMIDMTTEPSVGRLPVVKLKTVTVGSCTLMLVTKNESYTAVSCEYYYEYHVLHTHEK